MYGVCYASRGGGPYLVAYRSAAAGVHTGNVASGAVAGVATVVAMVAKGKS